MKKILSVIAGFIFYTSVSGQCPQQTSVTASGKCIRIVYPSPVPLPAYLIYNGVQFNYISGSGSSASPAEYRDPSSSGACSSYGGANASITLPSGQVCNYTGGVLPLRWLNTGGTVNGNRQAQLNWQVQENNVAGYFVERSTDGRLFTTIASLSSKGNGTNNYEYTDTVALQDVSFYRIKQKDYDGRTSYSAVIKLANGNRMPLTVYPNPIKDIAIISGAAAGTKAVLTDVSGKVLQQLNLNQSAFQINLGNYSSGVYFLRVNNGVTQKIIKQ